MQELLRTPTAMLGPNSTAVVYLSCCCLAWHLIDFSWFRCRRQPCRGRAQTCGRRQPTGRLGPKSQRVLLGRNLVYSPSHLVRI